MFLKKFVPVFILGLVVSSFIFSSSKVLAADQVFDWVKQGFSVNGNSYSWPNSVTTDFLGNIYSVGFFYSTVDFNPNNTGGELTSLGEGDIFITKYNSSGVFQWVKQIGGIGPDNGISIVTDVDGNVYTTGQFQSTVDFDPDIEGGELTSLGSNDTFVVKYNSAGIFQWVKQIGGTNSENSSSINTDIDGNIYTTGSFSGTADFNLDIEGGELTSLGNADIFITKHNSSGVFQWVKQIGGTNSENSSSIDTDIDGNIYTTGVFLGIVDFNPGIEGGEVTSLGGQDTFITKHNSSGVFQWVKQIGGTGSDIGYSIDTDIDGNIYTTGSFSGTADFNSDIEGGELTSLGDADVFILKYNTSGVFQWVKQIGGTSSDKGISIDTDVDGNVYTTGQFQSTVDFDPGGGVYNLTNDIGSVFISKLDSSGNFVFAKQLELTGDDNPWIGVYSITTDEDDNIYIGGDFGGTIDFNTEDGISELTSGPGGDDAFLLKLSFPAPLIENPTIVTTSATLITQGSATLNGEVTDNGGEDLSELGFQIGLDTSYIMATGTVEVQEATGTFSLNYEIDLDCNTTYHYRAYATNSAGTSYGEDMTFTTSSCPVVEEEETHHHSSKVIGSVKPSSVIIKEKTETPVIATTIINTLNIKRLLKLNMIGDDVKELQSYLNNHGYPISLTGLGSKGYETTKFGPLTKKAVILFQIANGLTPDGIVGLNTITKMNKINY